MNLPDDMQHIWQQQQQQDVSQKENYTMLMQLIREKRTGFNELVAAANQSEYLVAMILSAVLTLLSIKAKFPWVQAGFGLLVVAMAGLAIATALAGRSRSLPNDRSVRDHLEDLIEDYDRRIRFMRAGKFGVSLPLSAGLAAVLMGIPGSASSMGMWTLVCLLIGGFLAAQWLSYRKGKSLLLAKRRDAERLLRDLTSGA